MMIKMMTKTAVFGLFASAWLFFATSANADQLLLAADNCFAVGQQYAQQRGSTLVAAEPAVDGGKNVCKVVVLEPASNGGRPKREIVYIPQ